MVPRTGAYILLRLLVGAFVPYGSVVLALDTPIERRCGQSLANSLLTHQDGYQLARVSGAALVVQNAAGSTGITLHADGRIQAITADITSSIGLSGNAAVNGTLTATTVAAAALNVTINAGIGGNLTVNGGAAANTGSFGTMFIGDVQVQLTTSGGQIPDGFKALIAAGKRHFAWFSLRLYRIAWPLRSALRLSCVTAWRSRRIISESASLLESAALEQSQTVADDGQTDGTANGA